MKMKRDLVCFLLATLVFFGGTAVIYAQEWRLLGERKVSRKVERDKIMVTVKKGTFRKIKLKVRGAGVNFKKVRVFFGNGKPFDVNIARFIGPGGETRIIDLPGGLRVIKKVVFFYKTRGRGKIRATVRLWGRS